MQIGSAWHKATEEGKEFISVSIDEALKALYPQLNDLNITLWQITERRSEDSPHWSVQIQKKKPKKQEGTDYSDVPM